MKCIYIVHIFNNNICTCPFNVRNGHKCDNGCMFTLTFSMENIEEKSRELLMLVKDMNRMLGGWDRIESALKGINNISKKGIEETMKMEVRSWD